MSALKWAKTSDVSGQRNGGWGSLKAGKQAMGRAGSDCLILVRQLSLQRKNEKQKCIQIFIELSVSTIILCHRGSSVSPKHKTPSLIEREGDGGHGD